MLSYATCICLALEANGGSMRALSIRQIYAFFESHEAAIPMVQKPNWRTSVRHTLSGHQCFYQLTQGMQRLWCFDEDKLPRPTRATLLKFRMLLRSRPEGAAEPNLLEAFLCNIRDHGPPSLSKVELDSMAPDAEGEERTSGLLRPPSFSRYAPRSVSSHRSTRSPSPSPRMIKSRSAVNFWTENQKPMPRSHSDIQGLGAMRSVKREAVSDPVAASPDNQSWMGMPTADSPLMDTEVSVLGAADNLRRRHRAPPQHQQAGQHHTPHASHGSTGSHGSSDLDSVNGMQHGTMQHGGMQHGGMQHGNLNGMQGGLGGMMGMNGPNDMNGMAGLNGLNGLNGMHGMHGLNGLGNMSGVHGMMRSVGSMGSLSSLNAMSTGNHGMASAMASHSSASRLDMNGAGNAGASSNFLGMPNGHGASAVSPPAQNMPLNLQSLNLNSGSGPATQGAPAQFPLDAVALAQANINAMNLPEHEKQQLLQAVHDRLIQQLHQALAHKHAEAPFNGMGGMTAEQVARQTASLQAARFPEQAAFNPPSSQPPMDTAHKLEASGPAVSSAAIPTVSEHSASDFDAVSLPSFPNALADMETLDAIESLLRRDDDGLKDCARSLDGPVPRDSFDFSQLLESCDLMDLIES
ncbi:uncharacterized protein MONBRDRAFT_24248 [Monosiga brevicollis MX1]|uniref:Fork-head domain-containing protein n=1 Tax=Monosiga brevicollis TaxID=81824 RepID=A9UVU7_MONBE|nr:uncharacterized protein MONBRDRAFT_24248 [Monosiga brevicollis MX1]EDQ90651.1 predicted protein [Monosiga brevicollis MX1]|eukprot:XP_001744702.1 hypothetical protein [Monosiga brevicollis MX1]